MASANDGSVAASLRFDSPGCEGLSFAYDGFGRLVSAKQAMDGATRTLSLRTEIAWPDDTVAAPRRTSFSHDGLGRMLRVYQGPLGTVDPAAQIFSYTYDQRGNVQRLDRLGGSRSVFTRDGLGRPPGWSLSSEWTKTT